MHPLCRLPLAFAFAAAAGLAAGKLPALSDDAKAKAEEAKAKTAWSDKVTAFQTCKAQDKAVANAEAQAKKAGKDFKPGTAAACADPGPFVYTPPAAASAPASAAAAGKS